PSTKMIEALGANRIHEMEESLASRLRELDGVFPVTTSEIRALYPVKDEYDPSSDSLGRSPYTPKFYTALGTIAARRIAALRRSAHKVIVLDCDQTLWRGVCGEDGPSGVEIDD